MFTPTRRTFCASLAAAPLAGCVTTDAQQAPVGRFVDVNGRKLHYVLDGDGPPVILIHGASGNLLDWTHSVFAQLSERYRVLAIDRPGLGYSDPAPIPYDLTSQADMIHAGAAALGLPKATIVGHSYGGSVSLAYALAHPDAVDALVLLAAPSHVWPGGIDTLYRISNTPVVGSLFSNMVPLLATDNRIKSAIAGIFEPQPVPDGYIAHVRPDLALRPAVYRRNAAQIGALKQALWRMEPRYASLTMPIELIHGVDDTTVGISIHSEPFAEKYENATLTRLDGIGHMPHHVRPDALLDSLQRVTA